MQELISAFSDFTRQEDALIGRSVRAFGLLERSLGLLANASAQFLNDPEVDDPQHKKSRAHASALGGSLGDHAKLLDVRKSTIAEWIQVPDQLLGDLAAEIAILAKWRNLLCHGVWSHASNGDLYCSLWSHDAIRLLTKFERTHAVENDCKTFNPSEFDEMIADVLSTTSKVEAILQELRRLQLSSRVDEASTVD